MAVMYLGSLVEIGPSSEVYDNPKHPYTQALVSANPIPDPEKERARERKLIMGEIGSPVNPKPGCLFAPRCPHRMDKCDAITPELREVAGASSLASCHMLSH
jgi:oligopeptide transport system ATP-binding protein